MAHIWFLAVGFHSVSVKAWVQLRKGTCFSCWDQYSPQYWMEEEAAATQRSRGYNGSGSLPWEQGWVLCWGEASPGLWQVWNTLELTALNGMPRTKWQGPRKFRVTHRNPRMTTQGSSKSWSYWKVSLAHQCRAEVPHKQESELTLQQR